MLRDGLKAQAMADDGWRLRTIVLEPWFATLTFHAAVLAPVAAIARRSQAALQASVILKDLRPALALLSLLTLSVFQSSALGAPPSAATRAREHPAATKVAGGVQAREFVGGHLDRPPTLDGKVEDDEYRDAIHFDGLIDGETGGEAPEGGRFYLGYDARFVYFAARLVDRQPSSIQATEFRTNVSLEGNDTVTLRLDPFGTLSDFNGFTMNARGATNLDIAGGRAAKREWLGDIAAKGRVTADGWEVEARIPWSVMRLPRKGAHDLRFNVFRDHRRLQRFYTWANTRNGLVQNNGRWKAVDLPAAQPPMLMALPYAYGGLDEKKGLVANAGVDLRYPLTPDFDLVGTISPDFRNVERGVLSLDFSYFERLADETRPFFLEGNGFFGQYDNSRIFASQRIGTFDFGAKGFGKLGSGTDVGVLATEDFGHEDAVVARVRHQVDARSGWVAQYAGTGREGKRNDAFSGEAFRGVGSWNFGASASGTLDDDVAAGHRGGLNARYQYGRTFGNLRYSEVTSSFLPRLGFAPETDVRGFTSYVSQHWAAPKRGLIDYGTEGYFAYQRSYDLKRSFHEEAGFFPGITLAGGLHLGLNLDYSRYFGGAGDQTYGVSVNRPEGDPYRHWNVAYEAGTRSGQPYRNASAGVAYRPLPTLQLNGTIQDTTYTGDQRTQTILSANYDLDQYHSVGGRTIQGPNVSNFYVSFRQSGNRGAEYYLILGDPNAAHFRTSVILKAVFPVSAKL